MFNEDDEDFEDDDDDETTLESQLKKDGYFCSPQRLSKLKSYAFGDPGTNDQNRDIDLEATIDADTRLKLEALLANAG